MRCSIANKETGFLHAITTAGAMHAVVRGCSLGLLKDCQCDDGSDDGGDGGEEASLSSPPPPPSLPSSAHEDTNRTSTTPTTTRCSANVSYARRIAEMFINADEDLRNANGHISRHNNRAGREVRFRHVHSANTSRSIINFCPRGPLESPWRLPSSTFYVLGF